jgi:hypothetical protein
MLTVLDKSLGNRTLYEFAKFIIGFAAVRIVGSSSTLVVAHGLNTVMSLSARRQSVARG